MFLFKSFCHSKLGNFGLPSARQFSSNRKTCAIQMDGVPTVLEHSSCRFRKICCPTLPYDSVAGGISHSYSTILMRHSTGTSDRVQYSYIARKWRGSPTKYHFEERILVLLYDIWGCHGPSVILRPVLFTRVPYCTLLEYPYTLHQTSSVSTTFRTPLFAFLFRKVLTG